MTDQEIMREMAKKDIHSITIAPYRGDRYPNRVRLLIDNISAPLEWLKQRVDEVISYGRKSS